MNTEAQTRKFGVRRLGCRNYLPDEWNLVENERGRRNAHAGWRVNWTRDPNKVARMSQLPLFRIERPEPEKRAPDLAYIRKSLNRLLRLAREAQIMPWSASETESWEKLFPQLAASLPAEEAEALTSEFRSELARLRSAA